VQATTCGCGGAPGLQSGSGEVNYRTSVRDLSTTISWRDVVGGWRVRWGIGRMRYQVEPGLYRIGVPAADSPVLVTANYKLTVDTVRKALKGLDVWLLILDTNSVNVWCAAGKGTFGTAELVRRLQLTSLAQVVTHRRLILPQLGAVSVAAHEVQRLTGFTVRYGPVLARDIPAYLRAGLQATPAMRRVPFGWKERLVLTPMELVGSWKPTLGILAALTFLHLLQHRALTPHLAGELVPVVGAVMAGGVLVPLLLPWIPGRPFALKGAIVGALWAALVHVLLPTDPVEGIGIALVAIALTSYMAMTFTGATTFTTYAGTLLEVRWALPAILASAGLGGLLRLAALLTALA
jgi:CO dehydrogenase/acetyl-CoA synthase delta subunit